MTKEVTPSIKYIGVDDTDLDLFESQYIIPNGISYNSYVIMDEKIAVMDTTDKRKQDEWMEQFKEALDGKTPDYLIVHHMEPDHASSIGRFAETYPDATIVASERALKMMPLYFDHIDFSNRTMAVKEGDTLSLGSHTLKFIMAPMVHWPEVMVSYEMSEKVLFSADGFGKFGALCHEEEWACEARRYYFNIVGKYGSQVQVLLSKAASLDIATICPLHGPILTDNLAYYIGLYDTWSKYNAEDEGVLVAYASIHGNTAEAAHFIAEALREKGAKKVAMTDLCRDDMAEAVEDAFRYDKMIVAASTYDANIFPPMHDFLHHLKIKNFQNRKVGIVENGSWAPTAGRLMTAMLSEMKDIELCGTVVTLKGRMKEEDKRALENLAEALLA